MDLNVTEAHPDNYKLIENAYGLFFEANKSEIDCMGFVGWKVYSKIENLFSGMEWDFECHHGEEKFRPRCLRGFIIRKRNEIHQNKNYEQTK